LSSANQRVVERLFEAFNRGDVQAQLALLHEDYEWRPAFTGGGLLEGRAYSGHDGYLRYLEQQSETWAEIQLDLEEMKDLDRERVLGLASIRACGHHGVPVEQPFAGVWTVREGKLVAGRAFRGLREAEEDTGR
jgi:ketosteroid isomerase-like protein